MGSRIMHLAIAKGVCEQLEIPYEAFAYGSLIPDAHENVKEKQISHYIKEGTKFGTLNMIHIQGFLETYENQLNHPVVAGYYGHLITDQIWLNDIYTPIMVKDGAIKKVQVEGYYKDFNRLNGILIQEYQLKQMMTPFDNPIAEYNETCVKKVLEGLEDDFTSPVKSPLVLLNVKDIQAFIEKSQNQIIQQLGAYYEITK